MHVAEASRAKYEEKQVHWGWWREIEMISWDPRPSIMGTDIQKDGKQEREAVQGEVGKLFVSNHQQGAVVWGRRSKTDWKAERDWL